MAKGIKGFKIGHKHSEETKKKIGEANSKKHNKIYIYDNPELLEVKR